MRRKWLCVIALLFIPMILEAMPRRAARIEYLEAGRTRYILLPDINPSTCTNTAVDPDVQDAVDMASDGDTINCPAGSFTWSQQFNNGSGTPKSLTFHGSGTIPSSCSGASVIAGGCGSAGETIIDIDGGCLSGYQASAGRTEVNNFRFTFDASSAAPCGGSAAIINFNYSSSFAGSINNIWIIHHNDFVVTGVANYPKIIEVASPGGLIYRNKFTVEAIAPDYINTNIVGVQHIINDVGGALWSTTSTMGSADTAGTNNLYVETNRFEGFNAAADPNTSSRIVWRFNEMHSANMADHGYDSSTEGNRHKEYYNNTWYCDATMSLGGAAGFGTRGGTTFVFNNTFPVGSGAVICNQNGSSAGSPVSLTQYRLIQCIEIAGWPGSYSATYPLTHQVGWGWQSSNTNSGVGSSTAQGLPGGSGRDQSLEPLYIFNNTNNSGASLVSVATGYIGDCRAMAYSNTSKTSDTKLVIPNGSAEVAAYANVGQDVACFLADLVGGTAPTIADSGSNTWTALTGGTNGSLRLSAWRSRITTGGALTFTFTHDSSAAARSGTCIIMRGMAASPMDKNPAVTNDSTSPHTSTSSGTLSQMNELVLGYYALQGPNGDSISAGTGYTQATSCTSCTSPYNIGIAGTTGGADNTNTTIAVIQQSVTATTALTPELNNSTAGRTGIAGTVTFAALSNNNNNLTLQATDFIQSDREYYSDATVFDGTSGTGTGPRSSRPATCTTGVVWWSTDQGSWNTSGSGGQGVLDKCTAMNTWTNDWYHPYTYPHNLVVTTVSSHRMRRLH